MCSNVKRAHKAWRIAAALLISAAVGTAQATSAAIAEIQLVDGEAVVELTGSAFGKGPSVAFFDDFEAGEEGAALGSAPIRVGSMTVNRPPVYVSYGSDRSDTGILIRDRSLATNLQMLQAAITFPRTDEAFIHFTVHIPPGNTWPTITDGNTATFGSISSWKFVWFMDGPHGHSSKDIFDLCVPTHPGSGIASVSGNAGRGYYAPKFGEWWDWHGLNQISFWVARDKTATTPNIGSSYWRTITKTGGLKEISHKSIPMQTAAEIIFDRVNVPGWFRANDSDGFNAVYDNVYVASGPNALARIEITDGNTPETSSFVMVVPPLSWSDAKISFRVPAVVAKAREEFFVRVYTADGGRSDKSMRICLNCPRPPIME